MGFLKPAKHEFDEEKFLRCKIEGPQVDFHDISTLPVYLALGYTRFFWRQEHKWINKKSYGVQLRVHTAIFMNISPIDLKIGYVGSFGARNTSIVVKNSYDV